MNLDFTCPECGEEHPRADAIAEAEQNGYPVGEVEEMCPECGAVVTFEREVEEL